MERARDVNTRRPNAFVYAIGAGDVVKIGYSIDPPRRLESLQISYPEALTLYAMWPGVQLDEQTIHLAWDHRRLRGEWFAAEVRDALGLPWSADRVSRTMETWGAGKGVTERLILAGLASQADAGTLRDFLAGLVGRTNRTQYASMVAIGRLLHRHGGR